MTFRSRLAIACVTIALVPLAIFGYGVRREMTSRLEDEAARRAATVLDAIHAQLAQSTVADGARLASLAADLAADNRFRIAVADERSPERRWLLDWAGTSMKLGGLAMLQLADSTGRILSSGQFRNDYDRVDAALPAAIGEARERTAVVSARTPDGAVRVLATLDTFTVAGRRFTVAGGRAFDSTRVAQLSNDASIGVQLVLGPVPASDSVVGSAPVAYFDDATDSGTTGALVLTRDLSTERALRRRVDQWLAVTLGATLVGALLIALVLSDRMARPVADLAEKTARLDLDRLDQRFGMERNDEIGVLARTLDALAGRLRASVSRLRETERLATTGDLARQINHDIKNGLAPIRNVLRHLSQTADREPEKLAAIFAERRATLESSVDYLDELSRNYARLSPTLNRGLTDPRPVVAEVAAGVGAVPIQVRMTSELPRVRADGVVLRRILDNLVSNAVDALDGKAGTIILGAEPVGEGVEGRVRFTVSDTGRGMTRQQLDRAFDDFYTTKPSGTGLGLSVVRRLLTDLGGSIRVETAPGQGSTFTVEIPAG